MSARWIGEGDTSPPKGSLPISSSTLAQRQGRWANVGPEMGLYGIYPDFWEQREKKKMAAK